MTAVTPGREELAAEFYAVEYSTDDYPFSTAPQAERDLFLRMADIAIARLAAKTVEEAQKLNAAFSKVVRVMRDARNSSEKLMSVWADDMKAVEDVAAFLESLSTTGEPRR